MSFVFNPQIRNYINNTMRNKILYTVFCGLLLAFGSCRKDVLEVHPYPVSKAELALFMQQVPDPGATHTFQLSLLAEDKMLTTPNGVRVFLTDVDNLFTVQNSQIPVALSGCADLKIEVTTVDSKGDMMGRGLGTFSKDMKLLESAAMVRVRAYCGTTELVLMEGRNLKIQLPASNPADDMFVFTETNNADGFAGWEDSGVVVYKADWPGAGGAVEGYELLISTLGWNSCSRFLSTGIVTPFCTSFQPSFTGLNTQVYLVFSNKMVVAPLNFTDSTYSFCFPNVPAGYPVRIVSVSKHDADYWLGSTTTETGTNSSLPVSPQQTAAQQILGYLRTL
jgi:hypothetical protein